MGSGTVSEAECAEVSAGNALAVCEALDGYWACDEYSVYVESSEAAYDVRDVSYAYLVPSLLGLRGSTAYIA